MQEIDIRNRLKEWIPFALPLAVFGTMLMVFATTWLGELPILFLFGSDASGLFNAVSGNLLVLLMGSVLANLVFWLTIGAIYEFFARPLMIAVGILKPVAKIQALLPISITVVAVYAGIAFLANALDVMVILVSALTVSFTLFAYHEVYKALPFGKFPVEE